jgi:ABC-type nickel/cobalt efflux system permease component RcnA
VVKRSELGAVFVGIAIAIAIAITVVVWGHVFASNDYSNGASNLLGIIGTVPLIAALAIAAWARWHRTCAVRYCLRLGEHPVDGTLEKVCRHHHTLEHHERVFDRFHERHAASSRLNFGQSHGRANARRA